MHALRKITHISKLVMIAIATLVCSTRSWSSDEVSGKALLYVNIQFPETVAKVPGIRAYYCGLRITRCEYNNNAHKLTFTIPAWQQTSFNLIITEWAPECELSEENTVKFLKIPKGLSAKWYSMQLVKASTSGEHPEEHAGQNVTWKIEEHKDLPAGRHIPDDALIIVFSPDYIDKIEGGNASGLPTVHVKQNILELIGSEEKLHEYTDSLLLAALNLDSLHASLQQQVKHVDKTVIALTSL